MNFKKYGSGGLILMYGGIDLGGTKMEACLHDGDFMPLERRRVPTPKNYDALLEAIADQVKWLKAKAKEDDLPIGMGIPGFIDERTGLAYTVNICAMGKPLPTDLRNYIGQEIPIENDCKCFALSEANIDALKHYSSLFGLIMGTGIGGGLCMEGKLYKGWSSGSGEVGHLAAPAHIVSSLNLPLVTCGCSRLGCYETYLAGPGLELLGQHLCGRSFSGESLAHHLATKDAQAEQVLKVWAAIAGELIHTIQLTFDPEYIVLGGGLSLLPNIDRIITASFEQIKLASTRTPHIFIAKFGDSSGVRGAAMLNQKERL